MANYTIDSRLIRNGDIFVALTTGNRDGHDFAVAALEAGASKVVLSRDIDDIESDRKILVEDTLKYITLLASEKFSLLKSRGVKSVAITGSVGKTTVKDLTAFLLEKAGCRVFKTPENYNNHIGLPLTILNSPLEVDFVVLEMGMSAEGEISHLTKIAPADVRIITAIEYVHTENFEDGIDGVFREKCQILSDSNKHTTLIVPDNIRFVDHICNLPFLGSIRKVPMIDFFEFSFHATNAFLRNTSLALEVLKVFDVDIPPKNCTLDFCKPKSRGSIFTMQGSRTIVVDDSYNASPASVLNAFENLEVVAKGKKILIILGDMKELGERSDYFHSEILLESLKIATDVVTVGVFYPKKDGVLNFENVDLLIKNLSFDFFKTFDYVLVKGSNSVNLQKLVCLL